MDAGELAAVPLFSELNDDERLRLAGQMKEVRLPEGAELIEQGDLSYKFFVLLEGNALVEHSGQHLADLDQVTSLVKWESWTSNAATPRFSPPRPCDWQ